MSQRSLTRRLVRLMAARSAADPDLAQAERYVRDWVGSVVAGRAADVGRLLLDYGAGARDLEGRVFLAAARSHVTETDDLHRGSVTHPGCVVVPAALLLGRELDAGSPAVLRAVLEGYEVMLRVGESLGPGHYHVFHNTATAGVFGSAAAAASLLELDEDARVWALGSAGTQAAGLWQFNDEGAMSKPLHAGHAAVAGLRGARLAARGFTGAEAILEGDKGLYRALCPDPRPEAVLGEAEGWKLPETSLKPYPSCRHTHPVVDAALELRERLGLEREEAGTLEAVEVASYDAALRRTDRPEPTTPHGARFSLQFCAVATLLDGAPGLETFSPERIGAPGIGALLDRCSVTRDRALEAAYPERWGGQVRIRSRDGREHTARREVASGDPEAPLDDDALDAKLRSLLAYGGLSDDEARRLLERCRAMARGGPPVGVPGG